MAEEEVTTTTTTLSQIEKDRYRFGGVRYQLQGPSTNGPSWLVPEIPGLFAYPSDDTESNKD